MALFWPAVSVPGPTPTSLSHFSCLRRLQTFAARLPVFPTPRRGCRFHHVCLTAKSELEPEKPIGEEADAGISEVQKPVRSSDPSEKPEVVAVREALRERREKKGQEELSLSGVLEEVAEIEWPVFGRVLGTTGVVLAVITGSSLVLLTLNAVLAEISDRVFAGKGVQDFFS